MALVVPATPPTDAGEDGPVLQTSSVDLRAEIQGAFEKIVLPQIQKDLSALKEDVQDMRRDLHLLSSSKSRKTASPGTSDATLRRSAAPKSSDATLRIGQDTVGHNDSGEPAHPLRASARNSSWQSAGAKPRRTEAEVVIQTKAPRPSLRAPGLVVGVYTPSPVARPIPHAITESEDEDKEGVEEEEAEASRGHPPAPALSPRPTTPTDLEPSLPVARPASSSGCQRTPREGSILAAPRQSLAPGGEEEQGPVGSRKQVSWHRDLDAGDSPSGAPQWRGSTGAQWRGSTGASQWAGDCPSGASQWRSKMVKQSNMAGKSLENMRVSLAVANADKNAKTSLVEWVYSLTRPETYRGLTPAAILQSFRFDNIISLVILGNALTIGLEADHAAQHVTEATPWPYRAFEIFFCVVFTSELILRLWVYRLSFFLKKDYGVLWNYFDLVIVIAQLVQEVVELINISSSESNDAGKLKVLRILRVLRIVRIFRLVRVLHLISELRTIVSSIMGSFRSLFWTVILLLLMMYIVGVWFLQSVTDHFIERTYSDSDGEGVSLAYSSGEEKLRRHFSSLAQTVLSLWQSLSGGVDWSDVADPLISEVQPLLGLAFAGFIAFALLALMNVVTGVFVQTALNTAEHEEENFLTDQIIQLFHKGRGDDNWGYINQEDLEQRLIDPDMANEWKNINVSADEAKYVFALLDVEENGEVQFEEFLSACLRLKGTAKSLDMLIQLQESRHAKKMLEDMLAGIQDNVARLSDSFHDKLSALQNDASKNHEAPPSTSATGGNQSLVDFVTPSTSDDDE